MGKIAYIMVAEWEMDHVCETRDDAARALVEFHNADLSGCQVVCVPWAKQDAVIDRMIDGKGIVQSHRLPAEERATRSLYRVI